MPAVWRRFEIGCGHYTGWKTNQITTNSAVAKVPTSRKVPAVWRRVFYAVAVSAEHLIFRKKELELELQLSRLLDMIERK